MSLGEQFEQALNSSMKEIHAKAFLEAMMNLAIEIADKGSRGEQLTGAEKAFIRESTIFMLTGLLSRRDG